MARENLKSEEGRGRKRETWRGRGDMKDGERKRRTGRREREDKKNARKEIDKCNGD